MQIRQTTFSFPSSGGETDIHVTAWVPQEGKIRGVVQIAHGVAEYGARYAPFAQFLCAHGFAVAAGDHLGHGASVIPGAPRLCFGEKNGWWHVVDDLETLRERLTDLFPGVPCFLFGHSMGSFLTRTHMIRYPGAYDGYVLCGTGHSGRGTLWVGRRMADREIRRIGRRAYSPKLDRMAFGAYNRKFRPVRTTADWISANPENVDAYLKDPLCGGEVTAGLFRDLLEGLTYLTDPDHIAQVEASRPILMISGGDDPVGDMGKGVKKACTSYQKAGVKDISLTLYPELRHEILNEYQAPRVMSDILAWLEEHTETMKKEYAV